MAKSGGLPPTDPAIVESILAEYVGGRGATSIARDHGVDKRTVYNLLVRAGIGTRPRNNRTGNEYNMPPSILAGVTPTGLNRGGQPGPRKAVNEHAFDELTPESAYWIGYLFADGCISEGTGSRNDRLFLTQGKKHRQHLERFKTFLQSAHDILEGTHFDLAGKLQHHCAFSVTSEILCDRLKSYGVVTGKPRRAADHRLLTNRHFWRGCVDGDGCVYGNDSMYLSGQLALLEQWDTFVTSIGAGPCARREQPGCWVFASTGQRAREIAGLLYQPGDVALPDKMAKAACPHRAKEKPPA